MPAGSPRIVTRMSVRSNRIPQVLARLSVNAMNAVTDTANDLATLASQRAPVDTGALSASIYVNNGTDSTYSERVAEAENRNPDMQALEELSPEFVIPLGGQNTGNIAVVGVAAHYGIFQELGTVFHPPQSFMLPAAEAVSDDFTNRMQHVADGV